MKRVVLFVPVLLLVLTSLAAGQSRTYTIDDLLKVRRVRDQRISSDGRRVALTIGDVNVTANKVVSQIYVTSTEGGDELKRLTSGESSSSAPRWSPDGKKIAFTTGGQIWVMDHDGDNKEQVTKIS